MARAVVALLIAMGAIVVPSSPAFAHAELLQASPREGSTVGGAFHQIAMQFGGLDDEAPQRFELLDPSGQPIASEVVRDGGRIVLPIDPLTVPGVYTISYTIQGEDGDITSEAFVFRFDPSAEHPEGLTIGNVDDGFDWFTLGLLMLGAAIAGFLAHRVRTAVRDHRSYVAQKSEPPVDESDEEPVEALVE